MLIGAEQIISGIPGIHLDPFLLAQSQEGDGNALIMITHNLPGKTYDLLFLHGSTITECARMTADLRFSVEMELLKTTFAKQRASCSVYLFKCSTPEIDHFLTTLRAEPCLKVHVNAISRKQIQSLVKATGCRNGILERNVFQSDPPKIELVEVDPTMHLPSFKTGLSQGRLLLYDLEKNAQLKGQAVSRQAQSTPVSPPPRKARVRITMLPAQEHKEPIQDPEAPIVDRPKHSDQGLDTSNEFDNLITHMLSIPPGPDEGLNENQRPHKKSRRKSEAIASPVPASPPTGQESGPPATPAEATTAETTATSQTQVPVLQESVTSKANTDESPGDQKYIKLFQRLFRSFRQQAFECFGPRHDAVMSEAEQQVRLLTPEFDLEDLRTETVPFLLDIVQTMIDRASFLKRSKLRSAAQTLVADLYNKHYDLLSQYNAIDKVEQCYYQLKK